MRMASTLNISLPEQDITFLQSQTQAGNFADPSDYIHELIMQHRERMEELELQLLEALQDDEGSLRITSEDLDRASVIELILEHDKKSR
jgi:Arc/MetJ-type ribon-helix-helix transcriptional regulator